LTDLFRQRGTKEGTNAAVRGKRGNVRLSVTRTTDELQESAAPAKHEMNTAAALLEFSSVGQKPGKYSPRLHFAKGQYLVLKIPAVTKRIQPKSVQQDDIRAKQKVYGWALTNKLPRPTDKRIENK
jgi:hypothetical protein